MFAGRVTVTVDQRKLHSVSEDFVGKLLSRIAERADRETVSSAGLRLSGYEFLGLVEYAAEAMSGDLGISAGDVVAIRAFQGPIGLVIRYAAFSLGAIVFHIPDVGPSRQQAVIDAAAPTVIVTDGTAVPGASGSANSVPIQTLPALHMAGSRDKGIAARDTFRPRYGPEDVALLMPSGGTTSVPKITYRTAQTLLSAVPGHDPDMRRLVTTHLAYFAGAGCDSALGAGGSVFFAAGKPAATELVKLIASEQITHMFMVEPALGKFVAEAHHDRPGDLNQATTTLRELWHMGSNAPAHLRTRAHELFGDKVIHSYGASEVGAVTSTAGEPFDPHSTGRALPGAEYRIIAADGREAPAGAVGTIEAKTPFMGAGYWKNGTTQPFTEWFRSNDQGYIDPNGRLVVTGRNSDLIGGIVMPAAIEDVVYRLSETIEYVAVIPYVAPVSATPVDATVFIQSAEFHRHQLTQDTLAQDFPTLRLAVVVLPAIPLTEQGKPDRLALVESHTSTS
ncbi:MAG: fatty-acyl-CoA synthase [Mycobacterium sp.]|jgi:acyl-coenzyme A synthetase/AMP-(fatty) acid ligase|nr:AMP-dependent synthetase [Mycobacterium sp.]MDT5056092.1 fatty-acyl-CoA synthase [Mycobacterium sp.]